MITKEQKFKKIEYVAGVIEDAAAFLKGEIGLSDDDQRWAAVYLLQGADYIRQKIKFEREIDIRIKLMEELKEKTDAM